MPPGKHILRVRRPSIQQEDDPGARIERPEAFIDTFPVNTVEFPFGSMADAAERVKFYRSAHRKQVVKIQVEVPGRDLHRLFSLNPFHREEAVHFNAAGEAFIKMVESAHIKPVELVPYVTNGRQVDAGRSLCARTQGRQQEEDDKKPPYAMEDFHGTKKVA